MCWDFIVVHFSHEKSKRWDSVVQRCLIHIQRCLIHCDNSISLKEHVFSHKKTLSVAAEIRQHMLFVQDGSSRENTIPPKRGFGLYMNSVHLCMFNHSGRNSFEEFHHYPRLIVLRRGCKFENEHYLHVVTVQYFSGIVVMKGYVIVFIPAVCFTTCSNGQFVSIIQHAQTHWVVHL